MIESFFGMIRKKDKNDWQKVKYPSPLSIKLFGFIPVKILLIIALIFLEVAVTVNISDKVHSSTGQLLITIIFFYVIYKTIIYYKRFRRMKQDGKNNNIEKNLQYLIHSLKLYDEETMEIGTENEKRIIRAIRIFYKEDDNKVYVRIAKLGDRFTKIAPTLGENLESTLGLELDSVNSTVNYFEYVFLKEKDKRIDLS